MESGRTLSATTVPGADTSANTELRVEHSSASCERQEAKGDAP